MVSIYSTNLALNPNHAAESKQLYGKGYSRHVALFKKCHYNMARKYLPGRGAVAGASYFENILPRQHILLVAWRYDSRYPFLLAGGA
jgi:hypothetical protein